MVVPKMKIKCGVENCKYNNCNICNANALEVNVMGDGLAETSEGTCCSTFKNANTFTDEIDIT